MNQTPKSLRRSLASLKLPTKVPSLITYAQAIVKAMTGNPSFPSPVPGLTSLTQALDDLQAAESQALGRTKGAVAARNEKRLTVIMLLEQLRGTIQTTADADLETAASVIQSTGISVRKTPVRAPRSFAARPGTVSGSVRLVTNAAAKRASYEWQYSSDGGKTWVSTPTTLQAKTTVSSLTPGAMVTFRYRPVTKRGEGDWSQLSSLLVK